MSDEVKLRYTVNAAVVGDRWPYIKWAVGHFSVFSELSEQFGILLDPDTKLVDRLTAAQEILEIIKPTLEDFPGLNVSITTNDETVQAYLAENVGKIGDGKILEQIFKYLPAILQIIAMFTGGNFPIPSVGLEEQEPALD